MSTNYNILLKSEKKLKELIAEYMQLSFEIHSKLWNDIDKHINSDTHLIFDNTERRLKRSKTMEDDLLDECIWTISKDDPRANHLRFIISVIYSTKDITRSCEYAQQIAKVVRRNINDKKIIDTIKPISKFYLEYMEQIIKMYKSSTMDKFDKIDKLNLEYYSKFEKMEKDLRKKYEKNEIIQFQISQICRLILSTIERLEGIFSSTIFSSKTSTTTLEIKSRK